MPANLGARKTAQLDRLGPTRPGYAQLVPRLTDRRPGGALRHFWRTPATAATRSRDSCHLPGTEFAGSGPYPIQQPTRHSGFFSHFPHLHTMPNRNLSDKRSKHCQRRSGTNNRFFLHGSHARYISCESGAYVCMLTAKSRVAGEADAVVLRHARRSHGMPKSFKGAGAHTFTLNALQQHESFATVRIAISECFCEAIALTIPIRLT